MKRVAAIDCGTNSIRLLIADIDPGVGMLTDVDRRMEIVRLGQDVDRTGRIAPEAMARTLAMTQVYAEACTAARVEGVRFVATSATRDAENRAEFVDGVRAVIGVEPEVVPGSEEAALSFAGATRELSGAHEPPFLVVDLGGGSTEFVLGRHDAAAALSVDVGCVRLTERHLKDDPPTAEQIAAALADVDAAFARVVAAVAVSEARTLVGLAGSVTTVTAHALSLPRYDPAKIHRSVLPSIAVREACDDLVALSHERRAALTYMHPGRVDVIGAGALIWGRIVELVGLESGISAVVTSEHDILDGIAWSIAG